MFSVRLRFLLEDSGRQSLGLISVNNGSYGSQISLGNEELKDLKVARDVALHKNPLNYYSPLGTRVGIFKKIYL